MTEPPEPRSYKGTSSAPRHYTNPPAELTGRERKAAIAVADRARDAADLRRLLKLLNLLPAYAYTDEETSDVRP